MPFSRPSTETGDLQGLLDVLAPDVVCLTDGGGAAAAALLPLVGADTVAQVLAHAAPAALQPV
jgi:RNA polymerase sigma-70 factor (ECF subfamily)